MFDVLQFLLTGTAFPPPARYIENEIEYPLTSGYLFIHRGLYMRTMQTGRHLNTFLSSDTSQTLILVSFHTSVTKRSALTLSLSLFLLLSRSRPLLFLFLAA